jgi:hypothetical protein
VIVPSIAISVTESSNNDGSFDGDPRYLGLKRRWIYDRQILAFTVTSRQRATIDAWLEQTAQAIAHWEVDRPVLIIHEIFRLPLSSYIKERCRAFVEQHRYQWGRQALVVQGMASILGTRHFFEKQVSMNYRNIERRVFASRDQAMRWLIDSL